MVRRLTTVLKWRIVVRNWSESYYKAVRHELEAAGHVSHQGGHVWILTKARPLLAPLEASGSHERS